ncbi:MAG: antibiotic biosynthesis monooxygenase [Pseudomonadales bacterium]|uniref:ABM family monooxygenase n=1 Tax=Oleiphilus messinensis TaxID=141451 RepID=A0A1Y0I865_9GAMM|nr:antibiotic biosynthesis monooxygenase [Oleiphilus messinensis]ARU55685.1 ABM family monooxygenase [Oleiphilus messinensis]MCG8613154.1 antibiotic biosynthesis monooxygenase [Pseudomonadales bacterium]
MFKRLITTLFVLTFITFATLSQAQQIQEETKMNVIITFNVKEDKLASFRQIMDDVKINLPSVEGCDTVTIYNDAEDPKVFTLVETWNSREAHKKHIDGVVASGTWETIAQHLQSDPVSSYFQVY